VTANRPVPWNFGLARKEKIRQIYLTGFEATKPLSDAQVSVFISIRCGLRIINLSEPLILYSTITQLAYNVGEKYYKSRHYIWCAPSRSRDIHAMTNPPSSNPISIYWELKHDISNGDDHSAKIGNNRVGLIRGAIAQEALGKITRPIRQEIEEVVTRAPLMDFKPLFLVIPFSRVKKLIEPAPVSSRARATSNEYLIKALPGNRCDIIELKEES